MPYRIWVPTAVECGFGLSRRAGELLKARGARRVFVVTDAGVRAAGLLEPVEHSLRAAGLAYDVFDETEPNPSERCVAKGLERLKASGADWTLAVGGGSSMDAAKAISVMATNPGAILDYEGVDRIPNPGIPVAAIPTTAGTGSEVTAATIITDSKRAFKAAVISPHLFPKLALLDPETTLGLPPQLTAATGMDALTHAIESYVSKAANPFSCALAIEAIRMIARHLPKAYYVGDDLESRERMLAASMMAGAAFAQSRLGNVHAISHTLGGVFGVPHGVANAVLLPYVMKFNAPACPEKMRDIAEALGCDVRGLPISEAAEQAVRAVADLNRRLGLPVCIRELGISLEEKMPKLVADAMQSGNVRVNPRLTGPADIERILRDAYDGFLSPK